MHCLQTVSSLVHTQSHKDCPSNSLQLFSNTPRIFYEGNASGCRYGWISVQHHQRNNTIPSLLDHSLPSSVVLTHWVGSFWSCGGREKFYTHWLNQLAKQGHHLHRTFVKLYPGESQPKYRCHASPVCWWSQPSFRGRSHCTNLF